MAIGTSNNPMGRNVKMTPIEALRKLFPKVLEEKAKLSMDVEFEGQLIRLTLENITDR